MLLRMLLLLPLLLLACSSGNPNDIVFYKAPIVVVDGRSHTRILLLTGAGAALGVEQDAAGGLWIREGTVGPDDTRALLADLWSTRNVREKAVGADSSSGVYQISARVNHQDFSFRRYVDEPVAKEVASAVSRLDRIWEALPQPEDQVGAIEKYLQSKISRIRGYAVNALLSAWRSPVMSDEDRKSAESALSAHELVETNHEIQMTLHQALKKSPSR